MKRSLLSILKSKFFLAFSGSVLLISCGTQMGGYSETDGVYYDPNTDTLPEGVIVNDSQNRVGDYYDYQDNSSIIDNSNQNMAEQKNKYQDWGSTSSDWGSYAGTETNYYSNNWYGFSPYWNFPYYGSGFGLSFGFSWGWGSGWGMYGYNPYWGYGYSPYWNYYSPYYYGYYSPYYYGDYYPYYGYMNSYKRSGANGRFYNSYQNGQGGQLRQSNTSGFRNANSNGTTVRNNNSSLNNGTRPTYTPRYRNAVPRTTQPVYRSDAPRSMPQRSMESGTRSGGFNNGGSSGGGFRSGGGFSGGNSSSSGGGSRSGGGFRR